MVRRLSALTLAVAAAVLASAPVPAAGTEEPETGRSDLRQDQWALDAVAAPEAWEYSRGAGSTVALLGTGVAEDHPDLDGEIVAGPDLVGGGSEGERDTMLAGLIGASGHGVEHRGGMLGLAPDSAVLSVRVAAGEDDEHDPDVLSEGVREAVSEGAQVIVLTTGGGAEPSETERGALRYARERGAVVVAPAYAPENGPAYPAGYAEVIAVGSVDAEGALTEHTARSEEVALTAPGSEVVTTSAEGGYVHADGPAVASALVAGAAALVRAEHPQLRPAQVEAALLEGARPPGEAQQEAGHGAGVLDAAQAITAASAVAEDVPPFDDSLLVEPAEEEGPPTWFAYALAATVVVLAFLLSRLVMRQRRRTR